MHRTMRAKLNELTALASFFKTNDNDNHKRKKERKKNCSKNSFL